MKDLGNSQYNIDAVKNYWNTRPCNIRHSNLEFGTKEYFNEVENRKYFVEPHILAFADFKKWAGKKVLEVGCGIGTDAINFARAGAIYTGTDLSNESVEITRNRFKIFSCDGILFDSNFENLPHNLEGKQFDLIPGDVLVYNGFLEHWRNKFEEAECVQMFIHYNSVNTLKEKK